MLLIIGLLEVLILDLGVIFDLKLANSKPTTQLPRGLLWWGWLCSHLPPQQPLGEQKLVGPRQCLPKEEDLPAAP